MRHLVSALACLPLLATQAPHPPHLAIPRLAHSPSMARDADLSTWKDALKITDFSMIMPDDKGENRWPTIVHVGWGPDALYVAVEAKDPEPAKIHAARHMRDTNSGDSEFEGVDKYLKAFLGWQPNAFTNAYIGWSGQRHRDPTAVIPSERMVERGLFAKLAYAMQF